MPNHKRLLEVTHKFIRYIKHFKLCETFGINMIPVSLTGEGPDLDEIQALVETDESIRGIWCVPKYSNPTGEIYSSEVTQGLLEIFSNSKTKSVIFWDNAYAVHDLSDCGDFHFF